MYTQLEQRGMAEPPVNVSTLRKMKEEGEPIACLTAYDASFAVLVDRADTDIVLVGDEKFLPYQRPPLSKKFLAGEMPAERLFFRPASFYERAGIDVRLQTRVSSIDRSAMRLITEAGDEIRYHYTLVDFDADWQAGEARAGGDAAEILWADPGDLSQYELWSETSRIIALSAETRALAG